MTRKVCQGDILKIERIQQDVLVVSKDFFHSSGEIIGCPVYKSSVEGSRQILSVVSISLKEKPVNTDQRGRMM